MVAKYIGIVLEYERIVESNDEQLWLEFSKEIGVWNLSKLLIQDGYLYKTEVNYFVVGLWAFFRFCLIIKTSSQLG